MRERKGLPKRLLSDPLETNRFGPHSGAALALACAQMNSFPIRKHENKQMPINSPPFPPAELIPACMWKLFSKLHFLSRFPTWRTLHNGLRDVAGGADVATPERSGKSLKCPLSSVFWCCKNLSLELFLVAAETSLNVTQHGALGDVHKWCHNLSRWKKSKNVSKNSFYLEINKIIISKFNLFVEIFYPEEKLIFTWPNLWTPPYQHILLIHEIKVNVRWEREDCLHEFMIIGDVARRTARVNIRWLKTMRLIIWFIVERDLELFMDS